MGTSSHRKPLPIIPVRSYRAGMRKRSGSGRVTPKGTVNPPKTGKPGRTDVPDPPSAPPHELRGGAGKARTKVFRPESHNRGNR